MYVEMKLRQYACADCAFPAKAPLQTRSGAGSAQGCGRTGRAVSISRGCLPASGQRATRLTLNAEPQRRFSHEERAEAASLIPRVPRPLGFLSTPNRTQLQQRNTPRGRVRISKRSEKQTCWDTQRFRSWAILAELRK